MSKQLIDFAKGKPIPSPRMTGLVVFYPPTTVKVYGELIRGSFDRDIFYKSVARLTPEQIKIFESIDYTQQVEEERRRLMDGGEVIKPDILNEKRE
jgi:hypothetical protein